MNNKIFQPVSFVVVLLLLGFTLSPGPVRAAEKEKPLVVAVMDPLSIDLACLCVRDFAQRQYQYLGLHLEEQLKRPVKCIFSNSLKQVINKSPTGKIDLIIGIDASVRFDADYLQFPVRKLAMLSDNTGKTTFHGLFVVQSGDKAQSLSDLSRHTIIFGPESALEKRAEPIAMLKKAGITVPEKLEFTNTCKAAALKILDNTGETPICAILSNYSLTLLEGCQTVERGSLRILAQTPEVPFIALYAAKSLDPQTTQLIRKALKSFNETEKNRKYLESKNGFMLTDENKP